MRQVAMLDNANAQRLVLPACVKMCLLVVEPASGSGAELLTRPPALIRDPSVLTSFCLLVVPPAADSVGGPDSSAG